MTTIARYDGTTSQDGLDRPQLTLTLSENDVDSLHYALGLYLTRVVGSDDIRSLRDALAQWLEENPDD